MVSFQPTRMTHWWKGIFMNTTRFAFACWMFSTSVTGAELTHGPMVGHTTDTMTRIWVRAGNSCDLQVRLRPQKGGDAMYSEKIRLLLSLSQSRSGRPGEDDAWI